jgi:hypothetical protein
VVAVLLLQDREDLSRKIGGGLRVVADGKDLHEEDENAEKEHAGQNPDHKSKMLDFGNDPVGYLVSLGFGSVIGATIGHLLRTGDARAGRLRLFKAEILGMMDSALARHPAHFWREHEVIAPRITCLRREAAGDVRWWRRKRWDRICAEIAGTSLDELRAGDGQEWEKPKKAYAEKLRRLAGLL